MVIHGNDCVRNSQCDEEIASHPFRRGRAPFVGLEFEICGGAVEEITRRRENQVYKGRRQGQR